MNIIRPFIKQFLFVTIICIYRILLDLCYFNIVATYFSYIGFRDYSNSDTMVLSWVVLLLSCFAINNIFFSTKERISNLIICMLYLFSFVPFTTGIYAGMLSPGLIFDYCLYWLLLIVLQILMLHISADRFSRIVLKKIAIDDKFVRYIGLFSACIVIYISVRYTGLRFKFDLSDIYDLRLEARLYNMPVILSYLFSWSKAINPLLLGYCLVKKKKLLSLLYIIVQILNFGIDGSKATFFMPFLVIAVNQYFSEKTTINRIKFMAILGSLFLALFSFLEFLFFKTYVIANFSVRRLMFSPVRLHEYYYEFFLTNVPDYFRNSILRHFGFVSPYSDTGIARLIGKVYFGNPLMHCNNGLVSDAIANLGDFGIIIMPFLLILLFWLFDKSSAGIDKRILLVSVLWLVLEINSTHFFTALMTHGILITILLLSLMNQEQVYIKT